MRSILSCLGIVILVVVGSVVLFWLRPWEGISVPTFSEGTSEQATSNEDSIAAYFLESLKQGKFNTAFNLFSPDLQAEIGTSEILEAEIMAGNLFPSSWEMFSEGGTQDVSGYPMTRYFGTLKFKSGQAGSYEIFTIYNGQDVYINTFSISPR